MQTRFQALLLMPLAALAGCFGDGANPTADEFGPAQAAEALDLHATATTGIIRGYVVDEAIRPLVGANVAVDEFMTSTDTNGVFGFDGLRDGTHFITVALDRYTTIQQAVVVEAGVSDSPPIKVMLLAVPATTPYIDAYAINMFVTFKSPFVGLGSTFDGPLGQGNTGFFQGDLLPTATVAQVELTWKPSSSTSQHASLVGATRKQEGANNISVDFGSVEGASPLLVRALATNDTTDDVLVATSFYLSITAVTWYLTPPSVPDAGGAAIINQQFQGFAHVFHHFVPDAEWSFVGDGPYPLPDDGGR